MNEVEDYGWPPNIPITEDPEEILSRTANELRHPINAIRAYAELILNRKIESQEAAEIILKLASDTENLLYVVLDYLQERQLSKE